MSKHTPFTSVRQVVLDTVSELGVSEPVIKRTVVLTRDGYFVGHRFHFDGIQVVWIIAENVIRYYAGDGSLLKTVEVGQKTSTKMAA